jgi:hypothetical protein
MTCTISKLTDKEYPAHWRILVIENNLEIYHDTESTYKEAVINLSKFLGRITK